MIKIHELITMSVVPIRSALKSFFIFKVRYTPRRVWNFIIATLSMHLSKRLRKPVVWGYPPILMVEPTNICNLKCPMCPSGNGDMNRPQGKMDLDNFKKLMDDIGDYIYQVQFWNQGEPFINRVFLDFVRVAKEKGVMAMTSTNGHFIRTDETAEAIVKSGLDQIIFSMDGTNQETYEKYRVGGNYNLVLETLERLSNARKKRNSRTPLIELQFIVFKHNQQEIDDLIALAEKFNIDRIAFKTAQVYSEDQAKAFLPDDDSMRRYEVEGDTFRMKGKIENWCKRLWMNSTINWDGSVSPCCFDKDAEHAFAYIFENGKSFRETWKNARYQLFRKQVMKDRKAINICSNCTEGLEEPYAKIIELEDLKHHH